MSTTEYISQSGVTVAAEDSSPEVLVSQGGVTIAAVDPTPEVLVSQGGVTVAAVDPTPEVLVSQAGVTVASCPILAVPTGLTATVNGNDIDLAWTNNEVPSGVLIEHSTDGTSWSTLATFETETSSYTHVAPSKSVPHYYRVSAKDGVCYSDPSATAMAVFGRIYSSGSTFGNGGEADVYPVRGDRAAWSVADPELHASDLDDGNPKHHLPSGAAIGQVPQWDGTKVTWATVGDMRKEDYDTDDDGIVDNAEELDDGVNQATASEVRTHLDDANKHREIDDSATGTTDLWSASKINSELAGKADTGHTHTESDITDLDHTDVDALHVDEASEIHGLTEKTHLAATDEFVLESTADSYTKRRVRFVNLEQAGRRELLFSQVVNVEAANTTTETSIVGAGRGTKIIEANSLDVGSVVAVTGFGLLSATGTPALEIKVKLGGTLICGTGAITLSALSNVGFTFRAVITVRATGISGSVIGGGRFEYGDGNEADIVATSAVSVDTTGDLAVEVTVTWGTADTGNSITCQVATIEVIRANRLAVAAPSGLTAT